MSKKSKRRADLKSSILVLLLIAILLIASTYAWFTANTKVTVSSLDVHVEAKNGLQISTNAVDWKSVISNTDITTNAYSGNVNAMPTTMEPVSTAGDVDPDTGYLKMFYGTVTSNETTGNSEIIASQVTETAGVEANKFIAFDLFFKVDADTALTMTTGSNVIPKAKADGSAGDDTGLKNAARVAFLIEGNKAAGSGASTYTGLKGAGNLGTGTTFFWEPNADAHTAVATETAASIGITPGSTSTTYYGINSAFTTVKDSVTGEKVLLSAAMKGTNTDYFEQVTPTYITSATMADTDVFTLSAGVTKVRIYMWIEGQDIDCENSASGSDISFNLQFKVKGT